MILAFPDFATLRLVVGTGVVPAAAAGGPVLVSADSAGRPFVETDAKLPKAARDALDRLGVAAARRHPAEPEKLASWLQLFPAVKDAAPPKLSAQAPVLFELPAAVLLPSVVGEMLRLGNDRQSYRAIADADGERVLLRVIGPPYYTLLRALDRLDEVGGRVVRAYVEQAPRVWVELGHSHPFAAKINLDAGQLLLVRAPRDWQFLPDEPFRDIYDLLTFELPAAPTDWHAAPVPDKLAVPLRLAPGNAADRPELWVVRGSGLDDLDRLVRDADDRLTEQLTFAVATAPGGEVTVVLRTRPTRKDPPVLQLEGSVGYKPFWKIPNLYLPVGTRLLPTIRREQVRQLLAADTDTLVWLAPTGGRSFAPHGISEDSFRPLADWVEYVIDANRESLAAWVSATGFDFESFVCTETPPKPKAPPDRGGREKPKTAPAAPTAAKETKPADAEPAPATQFVPPPAESRPPSAWKLRRDELERDFLEIDGPLDDPARQKLWPELAAANSALGDSSRSEAAVCWANALWPHPVPPAALVGGWLRSETGADGPVSAAAFDARLAIPVPTPAEVRAFAASLSDAATRKPAWLPTRLPAAQKFLEAHDRALPVRAAWLAAGQLARLAGSDVLGLARARDRLLRRLLDEGLSPERDLPGFLRFAGRADADRVRAVRERAVGLHRLVRDFASASLKPSGTGAGESDTQATLGYIDFLFAFAAAKLGEPTAARALADAGAKAAVPPRPPEPKYGDANYTPYARYLAGDLLARMFRSRVEQAVEGKPTGGPLDPALYAELDALDRHNKQLGGTNAEGGAGRVSNSWSMAHYAVLRLQEQSRVLDPHDQFDPYTHASGQDGTLQQALANLPGERDGQRLARKVRDLLREAGKGPAGATARFNILLAALPLAARGGEAFAAELITQVSQVQAAADAVADRNAPEMLARGQGKLFERAVFQAAHFGLTELVRGLIDQFVRFARGKPDVERYALVNVVAGQCLRSLRKLGLRDEIDTLLRRLQDEVLGGKPLPQLRLTYAANPNLWADALRTQLNLAAGWLTFGLTDRAKPILDEVRKEVLSGGGKMAVKNFVPLTQAYIAALAQGPTDEGMTRIEEVFRSLPPARVTNTFSTMPYYSRYHLNLAEEVVLALVSDDFALGQAGRRWLDEDEGLVRRRIHDDMKRHLAASGV